MPHEELVKKGVVKIWEIVTSLGPNRAQQLHLGGCDQVLGNNRASIEALLAPPTQLPVLG